MNKRKYIICEECGATDSCKEVNWEEYKEIKKQKGLYGVADMNKEEIIKKEKAKYRNKQWFSLNDLADFIAEYNKDGKYNKTAWQFWKWLDKKCNSKTKNPNQL